MERLGKIRLFFVVAALLASFPTAVGFAPAARGAAPDDGRESAIAKKIEVSLRLAQYARLEKSPILLAAAGELLSAVNVRPGELEKISLSGEIAPLPAGEAGTDPRTAIFEEALDLAENQNNETLADTIFEIGEACLAGEPEGPVISEIKAVINPGDTDVYKKSFEANATSFVILKVGGERDMHLTVKDPDGKVVKTEPLVLGVCALSFTPEKSGDHSVEAVNNTPESLIYSLFLNLNQAGSR
ncbi:MAG: hypothetical protein LBF41_09020 [Deltaproteobacteria bacterium]|jgi:hypothetical protein|nr:hypothetical protein [Deltaproteobacteria bacterium]